MHALTAGVRHPMRGPATWPAAEQACPPQTQQPAQQAPSPQPGAHVPKPSQCVPLFLLLAEFACSSARTPTPFTARTSSHLRQPQSQPPPDQVRRGLSERFRGRFHHRSSRGSKRSSAHASGAIACPCSMACACLCAALLISLQLDLITMALPPTPASLADLPKPAVAAAAGGQRRLQGRQQHAVGALPHVQPDPRPGAAAAQGDGRVRGAHRRRALPAAAAAPVRAGQGRPPLQARLQGAW